MNMVELYSTRGVRIYLGMSSEDFINGLNSVSMFLTAYPEAADLLDKVQKAIEYRTRAEDALQEAKDTLVNEQDKKLDYDKTMSEAVDKFMCQVQSPGSFLSDGISPIPLYAEPQQNLTGLYEEMEKDKVTPNYVEQMHTIVPEAEDLVELRTLQLASAKELEKQIVRTCVLKMLLTHV